MNKFSFFGLRDFFTVSNPCATRVQLVVDQECINNGIRYNPEYCPVALAVKKHYPNAKVKVQGNGDILIDDGWFNIYIAEEPDLSYQISRFDNGYSIEPFETVIWLRNY